LGTTTLVVLSILTSIGFARLLMTLSSIAMAFWLSKRSLDSGTSVDLKVTLLGAFHLQIGQIQNGGCAEIAVKDSRESRGEK